MGMYNPHAYNLHIQLFGTFRLHRGGVLVSPQDWHTRQAHQLFKVLLAEQGRVVSTKKLITLLWPEHLESADKTLRSAASMLRRVLEPERPAQAPSLFLPRGRGGYKLTFPEACRVWIDTVEFERRLDRLLKSADPQHTPEQRAQLEAALKLYQGDYLAEDEEASWTLGERRRLRARYFAGCEQLCEWLRASKLFNEASTICRQALAFDPCHEPLYRLLMQCQIAQGDTAGALQTFEQCRHSLIEQLGVDPAPQTLRIYQTILNGPPLTQASRCAREPASPARSKLRAESQILSTCLNELQSSPHLATQTVALAGEAGVGKSFLLRAVIEEAHAAHIRVLVARCQEIEQNRAFAPLHAVINTWSDEQLHAIPRTILAQVLSFYPDIAPRLPALTPGEVAQETGSHSYQLSFFSTLFNIKEHSPEPLLLVWEDIQWADEQTLQLVHRLAKQEKLPILQILSYRPEGASENRWLALLLRALRNGEHPPASSRFHSLHLAPFTRRQVSDYLVLQQVTLSTHAIEQLHRFTQGNAFFLEEAVSLLKGQWSTQSQSPDQLEEMLLQSQRLRDGVQARIERLPERAILLLRLAAAIGHPFPLDLFRPLLSENDYTLIDDLITGRLLTETAPAQEFEVRLAFVHQLIERIIYDTCSSIQRLQLHAQIATLLTKRYGQEPGPHAAEIASHYRRAGPGYAAQLLYYELEAGDQARHTFSYRQALVHYDAALQQFRALPQRQRYEVEQWGERAYHGRRLAYEALLDWEGMQESTRHLHTWTSAQKYTALLSSSTRQMASIRSLMGHLAEAAAIGDSYVQHLQADASSLRKAQSGKQREISTVIDLTQRWTHLLTVPTPHIPEHASEIATAYPPFIPAPPPTVHDWHELLELLGTSQGASLLTEQGWVLLLQGYNAEAERCLHTALHAAEESDQITYWILAAMHLSHVYHLFGDMERSRHWFDRCIKRSRQIAEAAWTMNWPLLNQAYYLLHSRRLKEAEQILQMLQTRLAQEQDFLAHRYSIQIGFGLIAQARGQFRQAQALLQNAIEHQDYLYIEAYVLAELGLAGIAQQQGLYDSAHDRLHQTLAFCGRRSLLQYYSTTALTIARYSGHTQEVIALLEDVNQLLTRASYTLLQQQCHTLLRTFRAG